MKEVTERINGITINALWHESHPQFEDFVAAQLKVLNSFNQKILAKTNKDSQSYIDNKKKDWFGEVNFPTSLQDLLDFNEYDRMDLFNQVKQSVQKAFRKADNLGDIQDIPKKKLDFNDMGLGVFTFSRAAVSLRKVYEKGAPVMNENGTPKIVSDVQKVYAYFPPKEQSRNLIRLFMRAGATVDTTAQELNYAAFPAIILCDYLIENGYDIEIFVIIGTRWNNHNINIVKMKSADTDVSINSLLLMTSSPKWYRHKGFLSHIAVWDKFKNNIPNNLGTSDLNFSALDTFLKNQSKDEATPILMQRTYSEKAVMDEINRVLKIVKKHTV